MARLPEVGGDSGSWGEVLNDFLSQSHQADGTLKANTVGASQLKPQSVTSASLADEAVSEEKLSSAVQAKLNSPSSATVADGSITTAKLGDSSVTTTKLADSSVTSAKLAAAGAANGIATLNASAKLPETQVPERLGVDDLAATTVGLGDQRYTRKGPESVYRRIIQRRPTPRKVMSSPPSVTLSAANAATAIASGVTYYPKRKAATNASGGLADLLYDSHFTYMGAPQDSATYGTVVPDDKLINFVADGITGVPSSQVARWDPRVGVQHTGQVIEFIIKGLQNPNYYRLTVNGEYVTEDMQSIATSNAGATYRISVDFGTVATRDIILEVDQLRWGGVSVAPTDTVWALNARGLFKAAIVSDSIGGGASSVRRRATVPEIACTHLGIDYVWNMSVGGTGYINSNTDGQPFSARIDNDLTRTDPDIIILFGGYNDRANSRASIQAAAETAIGTVLTGHPKAALFVVGSWTPGTPDSAIVTANNAVKAAAATYDVPFVDLLDPTGATVTAANYDSSKTYRIGEPVLQGGVLYIAQATSAAVAFTAANWRAASAIFGTGYTGSTTGLGNSDVAIISDGVHPTILGAKLVGALIARRIYDLAYARVTDAEAT